MRYGISWMGVGKWAYGLQYAPRYFHTPWSMDFLLTGSTDTEHPLSWSCCCCFLLLFVCVDVVYVGLFLCCRFCWVLLLFSSLLFMLLLFMLLFLVGIVYEQTPQKTVRVCGGWEFSRKFCLAGALQSTVSTNIPCLIPCIDHVWSSKKNK